MRFRKKYLITFLILLMSTFILVGCSSSTSSRQNLKEVAVSVKLKGPEYTYPVVDATVNIADKSEITNLDGKAVIKLLPDNYTMTVDTYYENNYSKDIVISENNFFEIQTNTPDLINYDLFYNMLFWNGKNNYRWKLKPIKLYFDFTKTSVNATQEDKTSWKNQAINEIKQWNLTDSTLFTETTDKSSADVIISVMKDEEYYNLFPGDEGTNTAGRGGPQEFDQQAYTILGKIWIREIYATQQGLYTHEMGHVLGFAHPGDLYNAHSVMSYDFDIQKQGPTNEDKMLLNMKMNLPPYIPYEPHSTANITSIKPWTLPTYIK